MGSQSSKSSASFDMLISTISVSEHAGDTETTVQPSGCETLAAQDDLTLGRELLVKEVEASELESACGSDRHAKARSYQEIIPEESSE